MVHDSPFAWIQSSANVFNGTCSQWAITLIPRWCCKHSAKPQPPTGKVHCTPGCLQCMWCLHIDVCVCAQSARAGRQVAGVQLWEVQARVVCLVIFASSAPSSYSWRSLTLLKVPWRRKRLWLRSRWQRWGITGNGKCSCCTRTWTVQPTAFAFACHTRVHVGPELKCAFGPELQCVYQTRTTVCMLVLN